MPDSAPRLPSLYAFARSSTEAEGCKVSRSRLCAGEDVAHASRVLELHAFHV
jgi:hypothetical protein